MKRILLIGFMWLTVASCSPAGNTWRRMDGCRLIPNESNDGDSFHVAWKSGHYVFRLYFVDAPEINDQVPGRIEEQAAYWKISPGITRSMGERAKAFTADFLKKPFTVFTLYEDARGQGRRQRFFAIVQADGRDLSQALVTEGLARIHGKGIRLPDGTKEEAAWHQLRRLQAVAERERRGAWGEVRPAKKRWRWPWPEKRDS